jgi:hypothetical protein
VAFATLLLVTAVFSLSAHGATTFTIDSAVSISSGFKGDNQCQYVIFGTATGWSNNYHVDLQIFEKPGSGLIVTKQAIVTNGSGTWSRSFMAACGGIEVKGCLYNDDGASGKPDACDAEKIFNPISERIPSLSGLGLAGLVILLALTALWIQRKRRAGLGIG